MNKRHITEVETGYSRTNCMVFSCRNKGFMPGINYFWLNKTRYKSWMQALRRDPSQKLSRGNAVCSDHFLEEDKLFSHGQMVLKPGAIPKLKLGFSSDDLPIPIPKIIKNEKKRKTKSTKEQIAVVESNHTKKQCIEFKKTLIKATCGKDREIKVELPSIEGIKHNNQVVSSEPFKLFRNTSDSAETEVIRKPEETSATESSVKQPPIERVHEEPMSKNVLSTDVDSEDVKPSIGFIDVKTMIKQEPTEEPRGDLESPTYSLPLSHEANKGFLFREEDTDTEPASTVYKLEYVDSIVKDEPREVYSIPISSSNQDVWQRKYWLLVAEHDSLCVKLNTMNYTNRDLCQELNLIKNNLKQEQLNTRMLERILKNELKPAQIKLLKRRTKKSKWSLKDISKALTIWRLSQCCYRYMINKFCLPRCYLLEKSWK